MEDTSKYTLPTAPRIGIKGVHPLSVPELNSVTQVEELRKQVIEYLQPFQRELKCETIPFFQAVQSGNLKNVTQSVQSFKTSSKNTQKELNQQDKDGNTSIILAANNGNIALLETLKNEGASCKLKRKDGMSAIFAATLQNHTDVVKWLASNGVDVNEADNEGTTPIMVAAYRGENKMIDELLNNDGKINVSDNHGRTALMAASQQGELETVKKLIEKGANPTGTTMSGKTALFYAAMKNHRHVVEYLVQSCKELLSMKDVNENTVFQLCALYNRTDMVVVLHKLGAEIDVRDAKGRTPLMCAVQEGNFKIVKYLIQSKASVSTKTFNGKTVLDFAVERNRKEILIFLLGYINNCDIVDENGDTCLIHASYIGNLELVKLLVNKRANVNHQNNDGRTALMAACAQGYKDIVTFLISSKADVSIKSPGGVNAMQLAKARNHLQIVEMLKKSRDPEKPVQNNGENINVILLAASSGDISMLKTFITSCSSVNSCDSNGVTPLMTASLNGNMECVSYLLSCSANVKQRNKDGVTALAYAIEALQYKVIDTLIGYGGDLDQKNEQGDSLLHICANEGNVNGVKELVMLGADINTKNEMGKNTLMIASSKSHVEIVKYLLSMNAAIDHYSYENMKALDYASDEVKVVLQEFENNQKTNEQFSRGKYLVEACRNNEQEKVNSLLNQGDPVNFLDLPNGRRTPLIQACISNNLNIVKVLVNRGANVNFCDDSGNSALLLASKYGYVRIVEYLLSEGANKNCRCKNGKTALLLASQEGHSEVITCLLQNGALTNHRDYKMKVSALYMATMKGHRDIVSILLMHGAAVDILDKENQTPLVLAVLKGYMELVEILVSYNANVNHTDGTGRTPLMAAIQKEHLDVAQVLVKNGALIDATDISGMKAIDYAIRQGNTHVRDWLLNIGEHGYRDYRDYIPPERVTNLQKHDAYEDGCVPEELERSFNQDRKPERKYKVDFTENLCITPLMEASRSGNIKLTEELCSGNVDVNMKDKMGMTALTYCTRESNEHSLTILDILCRHGAEINSADEEGNTPLFHSIFFANLEMAKQLILRGANVLLQNNEGQNIFTECLIAGFFDILQDAIEANKGFNDYLLVPLMKYAIASNQWELPQLLSNNGINIGTLRQEKDENMLFICVRENNLCMLEELLKYNLDINHQNEDGQTCLIIAAQRGYGQIAVRLLRKCAQVLNIKDNISYDAFQTALMFGHYEVADCISQNIADQMPRENRYIIVDYGESSNLSMAITEAEDTEEDEYDTLLKEAVGDREENVDDQIIDIKANVDDPIVELADNDQIEIQIHMDQAMASIYKLFTKLILRDSPDCIQGFTRDWELPKIYIHAFSDGRTSAEKYITEMVLKNNPYLAYVQFEYITQTSEPYYLMDRYAAGVSPGRTNKKPSAGSPVFEVSQEEFIQMTVENRPPRADAIPCGSIGCFMYNHDSSSEDSNDIWAITAGHTFVMKKTDICEVVDNTNEKVLVTEYETDHSRYCILSQHYRANIDLEGTAIDLTILKLHDEMKSLNHKLYDTDIPGVRTNPEVFTGPNSILCNREVCKTGYVTGYTTGEVVETDAGIKINKRFHSGLFIVVNSHDHFAKPGDSGAVVVDMNTSEVLGMVIAVAGPEYMLGTRSLPNAVFCIRLDNLLKYAKDKWGKTLSFNCNVPKNIEPIIKDPVAEGYDRIQEDSRKIRDGYMICRKRLQELQHEKDEEHTKFKKLQVHLKNTQRALVSKQDEQQRALLSKQDELKHSSSELKKSKNEVSELNFELKQSKEEVSELNFELTQSKEEVSELKFELRQSKEEVSKLKCELKKLQEEKEQELKALAEHYSKKNGHVDLHRSTTDH